MEKKIKQYVFNQKRGFVRKRNEASRELKHYERNQNRENETVEDNNLGRFLELAIADEIYVNGLILHEIKNDILIDYTGDFEMIGSMLVGKIEQETVVSFKIIDDFENYFERDRCWLRFWRRNFYSMVV